MLTLQACRELKSYISEGRQVIRSIEAETYAENPPLFREYATAAPDIRLMMDNQFRNVKTHARLLSKATWYEWRMKLLEGLKDGLNRHVDEMKADGGLLSKYEELLNSVVPELVQRHSSLEEQASTMQQLADEMENCDQEELRGARQRLSTIDDEIASKKRQLEGMQKDVEDKTDAIDAGTELKTEFVAQIQEAERVKQECRGWSAKEISDLKVSVRTIERQTGWTIMSASASEAGPVLTMSYRNLLNLTFHPGAFHIETAKSSGGKPNMPLELVHRPVETKSAVPSRLSPIGSLVLKSLQKHLNNVQQSQTTPTQLLRFISEAWNLGLKLEEEARMLGFCGVTKSILSDDEDHLSLRARCTLLSPGKKPTKSKKSPSPNKRIDIDFSVKAFVRTDNSPEGLGAMDFKTDIIASKVYGFGAGNEGGIPESEMKDLLSGESNKEDETQFGDGVWYKAVRVLAGSAF